SVLVTNIAGQAQSLAAQLRVNVTPFLAGPRVRTDGAFEFTLNGQTNRNYTVQSSTNLSAWTDVTNMTLGNPAGTVADLNATNAASRFYRVRLNP
ncbi:MAG TPA: hypothetical protein VK846_16990, partial [Candidatus Limnocylindria bacterium]|nr:hypothetical protein [Candidatus Limnocylindria bacterium]